MEFGSSAEDLALTCYAHPSASELSIEAALAVGGAMRSTWLIVKSANKFSGNYQAPPLGGASLLGML